MSQGKKFERQANFSALSTYPVVILKDREIVRFSEEEITSCGYLAESRHFVNYVRGRKRAGYLFRRCNETIRIAGENPINWLIHSENQN